MLIGRYVGVLPVKIVYVGISPGKILVIFRIKIYVHMDLANMKLTSNDVKRNGACDGINFFNNIFL